MRIQLLILPFLIGGCAVQNSGIQSSTMAKSINPPGGKAIVYIVRPSIFGGAVRGVVDCDNSYLGSVAGLKFLYTIQRPGKHTFTGFAQNKSSLDLVLEPGKTYYIQQKMSFGNFYSKNKMVLLSEAQGKKKLAACQLSKDCVEN